MILKKISDYIQVHQRVDESALLKHFRLNKNGLEPMIDILIRNGHIQRTISRRGEKLPAQVFYSWQETTVIPMTTVLG